MYIPMNNPSCLVSSDVKKLKSAVTPKKPRAGLKSIKIVCALPNCTSSACTHSSVPAYTLPALDSDPLTTLTLPFLCPDWRLA